MTSASRETKFYYELSKTGFQMWASLKHVALQNLQEFKDFYTGLPLFSKEVLD